MIICVIPARGGSKRIPRKNIKEFNGKPIIAYSIEAAFESNCFDQVIVSTDDNEIKEVAKKYGAQVPFVRPEKLSNDSAGTIPVIKHAIEWMEQKNNYIKHVCCLYATAPFIKSKVLIKAYQQLKDSGADYCFSVTSFTFPIQRAIKIVQGDKVEMFYPEYFNKQSQDLEEDYHDAGQFYWLKANTFIKNPVIYTDNAIPVILPRNLTQDIDTEEDWINAEHMYTAMKIKTES